MKSSQSGSSRKAPPIPGSSRQSSATSRSSTPIKEKSLITVRRRENNSPDFDISSPPPELQYRQLNGAMAAVSISQNASSRDDMDDANLCASLSSSSSLTGLRTVTSSTTITHRSEIKVTSTQKKGSAAAAVVAAEGESSSSEEDDSSDSEDEGKKAPSQLIMEFLQCLMSKDHDNSLKLCKMILLYEPTNSRALQFLPLLEVKKRQEELRALAGDADSDDDTDTDDSDESDVEDEESSDDSEEDSDTSDEDEAHETNMEPKSTRS